MLRHHYVQGFRDMVRAAVLRGERALLYTMSFDFKVIGPVTALADQTICACAAQTTPSHPVLPRQAANRCAQVELPYQTALNLIKDLNLAGNDPDHPDNPDLMQTTWDVINLRCEILASAGCHAMTSPGCQPATAFRVFENANRCKAAARHGSRLCSLRTTLSLQVRPDTIAVAAVLLAMKLHNMPTKLINGKHWMLHEKCNADPKKVEGGRALTLLHAEATAGPRAEKVPCHAPSAERGMSLPQHDCCITQWRWTSCWTWRRSCASLLQSVRRPKSWCRCCSSSTAASLPASCCRWPPAGSKMEVQTKHRQHSSRISSSRLVAGGSHRPHRKLARQQWTHKLEAAPHLALWAGNLRCFRAVVRSLLREGVRHSSKLASWCGGQLLPFVINPSSKGALSIKGLPQLPT